MEASGSRRDADRTARDGDSGRSRGRRDDPSGRSADGALGAGNLGTGGLVPGDEHARRAAIGREDVHRVLKPRRDRLCDGALLANRVEKDDGDWRGQPILDHDDRMVVRAACHEDGREEQAGNGESGPAKGTRAALVGIPYRLLSLRECHVRRRAVGASTICWSSTSTVRSGCSTTSTLATNCVGCGPFGERRKSRIEPVQRRSSL